jgi:hypothetical protein
MGTARFRRVTIGSFFKPWSAVFSDNSATRPKRLLCDLVDQFFLRLAHRRYRTEMLLRKVHFSAENLAVLEV